MILRPYQQKMISDARIEFREHKNFVIQGPTGSGKSAVFTEMVRRVAEKGFRSWIVVPRNELLKQTSGHLSNAGIVHGRMDARMQESKAFITHVVSKDTLMRRLDKIKNPPDFIFWDECHIALDQQKRVHDHFANAPVKRGESDPRFIGFTATPERGDGRGLFELYWKLVPGPQLFELVELGYLSKPRYFKPPIVGIEKLKRVGTEYNADELEKLLEAQKVYGKCIEHYRTYADKQACIVFTRNVKLAEETAKNFRDAGYRFESIDGRMRMKEREMLLEGIRSGRLHGLTSADLLTYGVDLPTIGCIIMLRPTLSTALFFQMIGRGLRVSEGKDECVILDHVNNLVEHGHPLTPREWNFYGTTKRKKGEDQDEDVVARLCPALDFMYCEKPSCVGCEHNKTGEDDIREQQVVDVELEEVAPPIKLKERPAEERREIQDRINQITEEFENVSRGGKIAKGPVGDMLNVALAIGRQPMWVYHVLNQNKYLVNKPLLHEIARQKGYRPGWVWMKTKEMRGE
jgi:superfamily II DNA or RNA helicase